MMASLSHGDRQGFQSFALAEIDLGGFVGVFWVEKKNLHKHFKISR